MKASLLALLALLFSPTARAQDFFDLYPQLFETRGIPSRSGNEDTVYFHKLDNGLRVAVTFRSRDAKDAAQMMRTLDTASNLGLFAPIYGMRAADGGLYIAMQDLQFTPDGRALNRLRFGDLNDLKKAGEYMTTGQRSRVATAIASALPYHPDGHGLNVIWRIYNDPQGKEVIDAKLIDPFKRPRSSLDVARAMAQPPANNPWIDQYNPQLTWQNMLRDLKLDPSTPHPLARSLDAVRRWAYVTGSSTSQLLIPPELAVPAGTGYQIANSQLILRSGGVSIAGGARALASSPAGLVGAGAAATAIMIAAQGAKTYEANVLRGEAIRRGIVLDRSPLYQVARMNNPFENGLLPRQERYEYPSLSSLSPAALEYARFAEPSLPAPAPLPAFDYRISPAALAAFQKAIAEQPRPLVTGD